MESYHTMGMESYQNRIIPCLVFTGPVHWTEKETEIELNPTAKDWTTGCGCTNSEIFWLPVVTFVKKSKNQKNQSFVPSCVGPYSCTHLPNCWSLNYKSSQELVEIWPKTFLYATWMDVLSVFAIFQPDLNEIAWSFNQSTDNWNIYLCMQCTWGNIFFIWYNKFYNKRLVAMGLDLFLLHCGPIRSGLKGSSCGPWISELV